MWILHERVQSRGPTVDTMEGISSLLEIGLIMLGGGGGNPGQPTVESLKY